jgi:Arc/MetJ-type ribon-helix-helix transcriptional regulator
VEGIETVTVQLPEDLERYVRDAVCRGRFSSEVEALTEAVRLLRERESATTSEIGAVPAWKRVVETMSDVPDDVFDRIPADSSEQLDLYLYGTPTQPDP